MSGEYITSIVLEIEKLKRQLISLSNSRTECDGMNDSIGYRMLCGESHNIDAEIRRLIDQLKKTSTMEERNAIIYPMLRAGQIIPWN